VVAIVGPTGSGKSTLVNLLARFYDRSRPVLIDGWTCRRLALQPPQAVAFVFQETVPL